MVTQYTPDSQYFNTDIVNNDYLDILEYRSIPAEKDDVIYTLDKLYEFRPDLLAADLYGNSNLWWVFISRNPNVFEDPVFDFTQGTKFFIPKQQNIQRALGL
jgi:hypothetical protein